MTYVANKCDLWRTQPQKWDAVYILLTVMLHTCKCCLWLSLPAVNSGSAVPCCPGRADTGEETQQCRVVGGREETGCHDGGGASPGLRNPGTNWTAAKAAKDKVRITLCILYTLNTMLCCLWLMCGCYWSGKMCILDQIQMCLEEKMLQDELKEQEGQQLLENMERMQMEELKVHAMNL